jgi:hypothetical protein
VFGASSNEASARCNREGSTCRGPPIAQAESLDARQGRHRSFARISPASTGCYGFDHGPVYSPKPCDFPYNCEMFDGACGDSRAWAHTIGR